MSENENKAKGSESFGLNQSSEDHIVFVDMWFKAKDTPKNIFGSIPKKYHDQYAKDEKGNFYRKTNMGLTFNLQAWFIAWSYWNVQPDKFDELDQETWSNSLIYGGAIEHAIVNKLKIFYTYEDIKEAAENLPYKEGKRIGQTIANSQTPEWYKKLAESEAKKKAVTKSG